MQKKLIVFRACLLIILFAGHAVFCTAQSTSGKLGKTDIVSFNGGSADENEGSAELFLITPPVKENFLPIPRTAITSAIQGGNQIRAAEQYSTINNEMYAMNFLAKELIGIQVAEKERSARNDAMKSAVAGSERYQAKMEVEQRQVSAVEREKTREEAARKWEAGTDAFLKSSGIGLMGWWGLVSGSSWSGNEGGVDVAFEFYHFFGIQTGFSLLRYTNNIIFNNNNTLRITIFQIPIAAKLRIKLFNMNGTDYMFLAYSGIGINLEGAHEYSGTVESKSSAPLSFIASAEIGQSINVLTRFSLRWSTGVRYSVDLADGAKIVNGQNFNYWNKIVCWTVSGGFYIPLRHSR